MRHSFELCLACTVDCNPSTHSRHVYERGQTCYMVYWLSPTQVWLCIVREVAMTKYYKSARGGIRLTSYKLVEKLEITSWVDRCLAFEQNFTATRTMKMSFAVSLYAWTLAPRLQVLPSGSWALHWPAGMCHSLNRWWCMFCTKLHPSVYSSFPSGLSWPDLAFLDHHKKYGSPRMTMTNHGDRSFRRFTCHIRFQCKVVEA